MAKAAWAEVGTIGDSKDDEVGVMTKTLRSTAGESVKVAIVWIE
jgi:hypothetical protein